MSIFSWPSDTTTSFLQTGHEFLFTSRIGHVRAPFITVYDGSVEPLIKEPHFPFTALLSQQLSYSLPFGY